MDGLSIPASYTYSEVVNGQIGPHSLFGFVGQRPVSDGCREGVNLVPPKSGLRAGWHTTCVK